VFFGTKGDSPFVIFTAQKVDTPLSQQLELFSLTAARWPVFCGHFGLKIDPRSLPLGFPVQGQEAMVMAKDHEMDCSKLMGEVHVQVFMDILDVRITVGS
jgi:hypothetical protein